jgi:hypothetical protein
MLRLGVAVATLAASRAVFADDPRLAVARHDYEALEYEKCVAALASPIPPRATASDRTDAEVLSGVCKFELGDRSAASEHFRRALRIDPHAMLPPYASPKIVAAFASAEADVRAETPAPSPPPDSATPALAPAHAPAPPPAESPPVSRSRAIPVVALALGGAAVALGAVGAFAYLRGQGLASDANQAHFESDAYALGDRAKSSMVIADIGVIGAVAFAAAALIVGWPTR